MKYWIMKLDTISTDREMRFKSRGPFDTRGEAEVLATKMNENLPTGLRRVLHYLVLSHAEIEANRAAGIQIEKLWIVRRRLDMRYPMQDGSGVKLGPYDTEEEAEANASMWNEQEIEMAERLNSVFRTHFRVLSDAEIEQHRAAGDNIF